jgi:predicted Zn-dependent protease
MLRGLALIDLGKYKEAETELGRGQEHAPESKEIKVWRLMAQTLAATGSARDTAAAELEKASRKPKSKIGRHAHGMTMLLLGNTEEARRRLEQALEDVSDAQPNPVAYRTRIGLAAIERRRRQPRRRADPGRRGAQGQPWLPAGAHREGPGPGRQAATATPRSRCSSR